MTDNTTDADKRIAADLTMTILNNRPELLKYARSDEDVITQVDKLYKGILEKVKAG